jgi:hypothetical protein
VGLRELARTFDTGEAASDDEQPPAARGDGWQTLGELGCGGGLQREGVLTDARHRVHVHLRAQRHHESIERQPLAIDAQLATGIDAGDTADLQSDPRA